MTLLFHQARHRHNKFIHPILRVVYKSWGILRELSEFERLFLHSHTLLTKVHKFIKIAPNLSDLPLSVSHASIAQTTLETRLCVYKRLAPFSL